MNCLALNLKNKTLGASMFLENKFVIMKDFFDGEFLERTKTLIYKFGIEIVVASINLGLRNFDIIKECGVDVVLMDKIVKKVIFPRDGYSLGANSLRYLNCYLTENLADYTPFNDTKVCENFVLEDSVLFKIGNISAYELFCFNDGNSLYFSSTTLMGINLFKLKTHPNPLIISNKKEKTLFSCINECQTNKGKNLLKHWLCFPLTDPKIIAERRRIIEFIIINKIDFDKTLKKCKFIDNEKDYIIYGVKVYLSDLKELLNTFSLIEDSLHKVYKLDIQCDFELLTHLDPSDQYIFQPFNEKLEELREIYEDLPTYLDDIAKKVFDEYKIDCSVIYFPQLGYLIESSEELNFDLIFCLQKKFYYKNEFMKKLDENLGDIKNHVYDLEISIANNFLIEVQEDINKIKEYLANVDCYNSLAQTAIKYDWCSPEICNSFEINGLFGIFHKTTNNINFARPIILTGENGSGKSTFMKNMAYVIILNQIGSFVPCKSAKLPIIDKILTKFCIKENTSSFLTELMQIEEIIKFSTSKSLILVDELGICTSINEGVSFFLSFLHHNECSYFVASTHFLTTLNVSEHEHPFLKKFNFLFLKRFKLQPGIYKSKDNPLITKLQFGDEFMEVFNEIKQTLEANKVLKIENEQSDELRDKVEKFFEEE